MILTRREIPIAIVNAIYIPIFTLLAIGRANYEFLLYVGVILLDGGLILWKQRSVQFGPPILWGLTVWGFLHMAGGNVSLGEDVLYGLMLIPVYEPLHILRYDQVVHLFGFGVATLICHHLLCPYLKEGVGRTGCLFFLIVLMGSGFGALNEIVEFIAVLTFPETGVGGYKNTLVDLVFNLLGGVIAATWLTASGRLGGEAKVAP